MKFQLSVEDLKALYLGKVVREELRSLVPVDYSGTPDVKLMFLEDVIGLSPSAFRSHWSRIVFTGAASSLQTVRNERELQQKLKDTPEAIGYIFDNIAPTGLRVVLTLSNRSKSQVSGP